MEMGCNGGGGGGGVKVTFIETQFVTSDAAGFKSLVQRLTGNDAAVTRGAGTAPPPLQRPRPCRADGWRGAGADGSRGGEGYQSGGTAEMGRRAAVPPAPWVDEMLYEAYDLAEMFCVDIGASGRCHGGGYGGFPC